uniref:Uncharacterized protein n=1 Tax=Physcomitrium patens TaxID=3218 RepID=A9S764_PHYPA|nr:hypothetical protein PHYPA_009477 [Physcomitrium patens]
MPSATSQQEQKGNNLTVFPRRDALVDHPTVVTHCLKTPTRKIVRRRNSSPSSADEASHSFRKLTGAVQSIAIEGCRCRIVRQDEALVAPHAATTSSMLARENTFPLSPGLFGFLAPEVQLGLRVNAWMDGCMDRWIYGCMDRWMDACMDGWMRVWIIGCMCGWMDGCMDGWMHGWMDGWMHGCMGGWMDGWMHGWMDGWMDAWVDGWM